MYHDNLPNPPENAIPPYLQRVGWHLNRQDWATIRPLFDPRVTEEETEFLNQAKIWFNEGMKILKQSGFTQYDFHYSLI